MNELKLAVLVVSIGKRPFTPLTLKNIRAYSERIGAAIIIERKVSIPFKLRVKCKLIKPKRKNIECYLQKMIGIYDTLEDYDRVLLLDDSCLVSRDAPNIFEKVPIEEIGAFSELECLDFKSPSYDKKFIFERKGVLISEYYNAGVLVVSKRQRELFSPKNLMDNLDLFEGLYPVQAYFAYIVHLSKAKIKRLSSDWNFIPVFNYADNDDRRLESLSIESLKVIARQNVVHVTGYYQNRHKIIAQIHSFLNDK